MGKSKKQLLKVLLGGYQTIREIWSIRRENVTEKFDLDKSVSVILFDALMHFMRNKLHIHVHCIIVQTVTF